MFRFFPARFSAFARILSGMALASIVSATTAIADKPNASDDDAVTYNRDIRPILSTKCFQCHGFDVSSREADLRLDIEDASRDAIEPGDLEFSELWLRLISDEPDTIMPPPEIEKAVTENERELIRRWIEQGATYEDHWIYEPPAPPKQPTGPDASLTSKVQTINDYVQQGWQQTAIEPVAFTDPRTLLRRLSFDLRGVPPTNDEVEFFVAAPSEANYLEFVDQWIDSIEYAENQALRWLDLVRFSDTSGLVSDEPIATGLYRKYVVESFHDNQPFDQFSIEQLAGDLLDDPTDQQLIASAYNRLIKTNCEAGVINDEALYAMKGEHVRAVGTVWLAATTGCAECHDHKFDPITANDYYSLAAFFDDLVEVGVYTPGDYRKPIHFVHDHPSDRQSDRTLTQQIRDLQTKIFSPDIHDDELEAWRTVTAAELKDKTTRDEFVWIDANDATAMIHEGSYKTERLDDRTARVTESDGHWVSHQKSELISGFFKGKSITKDDAEAKFFVDVWIDPADRPEAVAIQVIAGMYGRVGWAAEEYQTYYWGAGESQESLASHFDQSGKTTRVGDLPKQSGWVRLRMPTKMLGHRYEIVGAKWGHAQGRVGWGDTGIETIRSTTRSLQLAETLLRHWWNQPYYRMTYEKRMELVGKSVLNQHDVEPKLQSELTRLAYQESTQADAVALLRKLEAQRSRIRSDATITLVSQTGTPKTTQLLPRGDFMNKSGPVVEPAIPEFLGNLNTGERRATRLDLARWIFADENPITSRVFVNRVWQQFFGRGISRTLDDSGGQGDWPSRPELLDWLACEFRDNGWDRKSLTRMMVLTDAYRLSSEPTPAVAENDPGNEWFAHQTRFRIAAEQIRDTALTASGLLSPTQTVPEQSFFPYQPTEYWKRSSKIMYGSRQMPWRTSQAEDQHRRTLYTFWKRQNIHPTMLALDAPTRQECSAIRMTTNTPAQALALLNDPIFVDAAIGLAERVADESQAATHESRIQSLFRHSLQRDATKAETDSLNQLIKSQTQHYQSHPEDAIELVSIGNRPRPNESDTKTPADELADKAAWTLAARVVLNLHEFVTRP